MNPAAMDGCTEAKRIMVQAFSKMYSSRSQRGGLSLHRSLLLTLVMKAARDAYHTARLLSEEAPAVSAVDPPMDTSPAPESSPPPPPGDSAVTAGSAESNADKENCGAAAGQSRKRRGKSCDSEPDFLPCKRAKLEPGEVRRALQDAAARGNSAQCGRETDTLPLALITLTVATC